MNDEWLMYRLKQEEIYHVGHHREIFFLGSIFCRLWRLGCRQRTTSPEASPVVERRKTMKIVVIGGTGLIGSKTVAILRQGGHESSLPPQGGVNTITGEGLKEALAGAQVVIDLAEFASFEDKAVLEFFETSGRNFSRRRATAGVRHHVHYPSSEPTAPDNGYFRAKVAQEKLIKASGIPSPSSARPSSWNFSAQLPIQVRMETWFRISPGLFQPIASDDVAPRCREASSAAQRHR